MANQTNLALRETGIATDSVLTPDVEYIFGDDLVKELPAVRPGPETTA